MKKKSAPLILIMALSLLLPFAQAEATGSNGTSGTKASSSSANNSSFKNTSGFSQPENAQLYESVCEPTIFKQEQSVQRHPADIAVQCPVQREHQANTQSKSCWISLFELLLSILDDLPRGRIYSRTKKHAPHRRNQRKSAL